MDSNLDDEFARLMASSGLSGEDLAELGGLNSVAGGELDDVAAGQIPDSLPPLGQASLGGEEGATKRLAVGLIMTPFARATPLQMVLALEGLDLAVIETSTGAIAAVELEVLKADDWDVAELLGSAEMPGASPVLEKAAAALAGLSREGVIALVSELATDVGIDQGLSGHITARRYLKGEAPEEIPAGLVLAQADQLVEDLLLGSKRVAEVAAPEANKLRRRWGFKGGKWGPKGT
ncbi:MAG: hypothetical protein Q3999_08410 [Buchananella hordeovulneris]|nr:hypothetical protein [Buchananella hordeovulneris]